MDKREATEALFGNFASRHEDNLKKRCEDLGWGASGWERFKMLGWAKPLPDGVSYERKDGK